MASYNNEFIRRNEHRPEIYLAPPYRALRPEYKEIKEIDALEGSKALNTAAKWENYKRTIFKLPDGTYHKCYGSDGKSGYTYTDLKWKTVKYEDITANSLGWDGVKYVMSQYESLIWTERAREPGDFEIKIGDWNLEGIKFSLYAEGAAEAVSPGWYVWIPLDISETVMMIEKVTASYDDEGRQVVTFSGRDLRCILDRRIIGRGYGEGINVDDSHFAQEFDVGGYCASSPWIKSGGTWDLASWSDKQKTHYYTESNKLIGTAGNGFVSPQFAVWSMFCLAFKPSWKSDNHWQRYTTSSNYSTQQEHISPYARRLIGYGKNTSDPNEIGYEDGSLFCEATNDEDVYYNNPDILFDPVARYQNHSSGTMRSSKNNWYILAAQANKYDSGFTTRHCPNAGKTTNSTKPRKEYNSNWNNLMIHWSKTGSTSPGTSDFGGNIQNLYLSAAGFTQAFRTVSQPEWKSTTSYVVNQRCWYQEVDYKCVKANTNHNPLTGDENNEYWETLTKLDDNQWSTIHPIYKSATNLDNAGFKWTTNPSSDYGGLDRYSYAAVGYGLRANYWEIGDIAGKTFLKWIEEMATTYSFSFKIYPHPKSLKKGLVGGCKCFFLECVPVCDRSWDNLKSGINNPKNAINPVCFSIDNGALKNTKWTFSINKVRNYVEILGQHRIQNTYYTTSTTNSSGETSETEHNAETDFGYVFGPDKVMPLNYKFNEKGERLGTGTVTCKQWGFWTRCTDKADGTWNKRYPNAYAYLDRRESQIESSYKRSDYKTHHQYIEALVYEGRKEIYDKVYEYGVEGEVNQNNPVFAYQAAYNLGDYVSVHTPFLMTKKAMIAEYIHSWDSDGYREYPTFTYIDYSEAVTT